MVVVLAVAVAVAVAVVVAVVAVVVVVVPARRPWLWRCCLPSKASRPRALHHIVLAASREISKCRDRILVSFLYRSLTCGPAVCLNSQAWQITARRSRRLKRTSRHSASLRSS